MDMHETLTIPGQLSSLSAVTDFFTRAGRHAGFDDQSIYDIQLAVDEAFSNIIEYAYDGGSDQPIECTYQISNDSVTMTLHDYGTPFDPASVPEPDLLADLQSRTTGGLGVFIIHRLMDCVEFDCGESKGNTLTMVKSRGTPR